MLVLRIELFFFCICTCLYSCYSNSSDNLYDKVNTSEDATAEIRSTAKPNLSDSLYNWNKEYKSSKYDYKIKVPETFRRIKSKGPHIEMNFLDAFGSSISVNISPRQPDEYNITAHDYTSKTLEAIFKFGTPNVKITFSKKLFIGAEKAFLIELENANPNLKSMECFFYHKDLAFVLTGTCEIKRFSDYRNLFESCFNSLKL